MSELRHGGPAFPGKIIKRTITARGFGGEIFDEPSDWSGMTLRDYFAAHAAPICIRYAVSLVEAAQQAYAFADAMLKEREK